MEYLRIKNNGLIEPAALTLVGASTKRNDDSSIGQFGSGNKFSLAYLLRNNFEVKIFSGTEEIDITTKKEVFRNQEFDVVYINGEKTSITTQMGKDWKTWKALREIYCNALDEGYASIAKVDNIDPDMNETHFYIKINDEIEEFVDNFDKYFSENKKVLFECEYGKILEKTSETANIYRRGVRCYDTSQKSAFDYDINDIEINESRYVKYNWYIQENIINMVFQCGDESIIRKILSYSSKSDYIEEVGISSSIRSSLMSDEFKEVIKNIKTIPSEYAGLVGQEDIHKYIQVPKKLFDSFRDTISDENTDKKFKVSKDRNPYVVSENPSKLNLHTLKKAKDFLRECKLDINYDITIVKFADQNTLGSVEGEGILISELALERGVNDTVNTLIEEYIHIKYGCRDETRHMQTSIITEFVTYMKNINTYAI